MTEAQETPTLSVRDLNVYFGEQHALKDVSFDVFSGKITAIIGPSGCGKSTILKAIARLLDETPNARVEGSISLQGRELYSKNVDVDQLRGSAVYVDQRPTVWSISVYDNVAMPARTWRLAGNKAELDEIVEISLRKASLWDEVKARLDINAAELSAGQQQRLSIARALSLNPPLLLLDEPTANLDPICTSIFEDFLHEIRDEEVSIKTTVGMNYSQSKVAVLIVTHSMQQAARISQLVGMMHLGNMVEYGKTEKIFTNPTDQRLESFITGLIG